MVSSASFPRERTGCYIDTAVIVKKRWLLEDANELKWSFACSRWGAPRPLALNLTCCWIAFRNAPRTSQTACSRALDLGLLLELSRYSTNANTHPTLAQWQRTRRQQAQPMRPQTPRAACPTTNDCDVTYGNRWRRRGRLTTVWCDYKIRYRPAFTDRVPGANRGEHRKGRDSVPGGNERRKHHQGLRQLHQGRNDGLDDQRAWHGDA